MMNKKLSLNLLILLVKCWNLNLPLISATYLSPSDPYIHSQCQGLNSVYDSHGNLSGYRGMCDVSKWDGQSPSLNSMHPIDMEMVSNSMYEPGTFDTQSNYSWRNRAFQDSTLRKLEYKRSPDNNFFDWLSPHHDIIRNHPRYIKAHSRHRKCILKKKSGLFDFIGKLFDSGTKRNYDDPYLNLNKSSRCLKAEYYKSNPISVERSNFDPFAIDMGYNIQNLRDQMNATNDKIELERTKNKLHSHYDRLHRHLDCHCHHELSGSGMYGVHHYPITDHSIQTLSYPNPYQNSYFPSQMNSTLPMDPSMDLEDEHAALMRMSGLASQQAHNLNQFDSSFPMYAGSLRMQIFHPANSDHLNLMNNIRNNYDESDWNRLKIEKVIVIKRVKVPVVQKIPIPVPVPVPVPFPVPSAGIDSSGNSYSNGYDGGEYELLSTPQGYIGDNTYMVDAEDKSPIEMDSIVHAISGAPCNCLNPHIDPYQPGSMKNSNYTTPSYFNPNLSMQPNARLTLPTTYDHTNRFMSMPQSNQVSAVNNSNIRNSLIQPVNGINVPQPFPEAQNIAQTNVRLQQPVLMTGSP